MDTIDSETRSRNMSHIRSKNTKPELLVRSALFRRGFRFRVNCKKLPGHPDIVLPKYHAVIFINGCFWHGHENCVNFRLPGTRTDFWREKIKGNVIRDKKERELLHKNGWRICIVWECRIRTKKELNTLDAVIDEMSSWIKSSRTFLEIRSESTYRIKQEYTAAVAENEPEYKK